MSKLDIHFSKGKNGVDLIFYKSVTPQALVSQEGIFLEANSAFSQFFGYLPNEIVGKPSSDFTHPEDVEADKAAVTTLLAREHGATHYEMDKRYITKRGKSIWLRLVVDAIWEKNDADGGNTFSHFYVVALPYSEEVANPQQASASIEARFDPIECVKENKLAAVVFVAIVCLLHPDIVRSILEILKR